MIQFDISIPNYGQSDPLQASREKAVATVLAVVTQEFPDIPFEGGRPTTNEQCAVWQQYGHEYSVAGRATILGEIGTGDLNASDRPTIIGELGGLVLGFVDDERHLRAEGYRSVLPESTVEQIELSDQDRQRVRLSIANDWDMIRDEHKYAPNSLGQIASRVLLSHVMRRMTVEKTILSSQLRAQQQEVDAQLLIA